MQLKTLYLRNFRNFASIEIPFEPGLNIIWGGNAQGKTNLLEAISFLSTGRSFRSLHLSELIREGESFFCIEAKVVQNNVSQLIKLSFDGQMKRLQLNSNSYASFNPLLGTLPLVLYSQNDAELISGSPAYRRRFLNLHLAQSDPLYVHHFSRFIRAMKQRNCLLRAQNSEPIECWEAEMAHSAAYLLATRKQLVDELQSPLAGHGRTFSQSELHELRYHPSFSENYLQQLQKNRRRDKELGLTTAGPHRDDLSFWIGRKAAKIYASEGQKKTVIAALRLAEWERLAIRLSSSCEEAMPGSFEKSLREKAGYFQKTDEAEFETWSQSTPSPWRSCVPLMAVDDLGLALDESRQARFREKLQLLGQVFITTPFPISQIKAHHIHIESGAAADHS